MLFFQTLLILYMIPFYTKENIKMEKKNNQQNRNAQDIIDDTYNKRDFEILEKDMMNSYVMPLDMVKDVDSIDAQHFYPNDFEEYLKNNKI